MRLSGRDQAQVCGSGLDLGLKPVSVWVLGRSLQSQLGLCQCSGLIFTLDTVHFSV